MDKQGSKMRCSNCGTEFTPTAPLEYRNEHEEWGYECPVCQFHVPTSATAAAEPATSLVELETELRALLAKAHSGGLAATEIVEVLRSELEWEAELAHAGRRVTVQIIDIGDVQTEVLVHPSVDPREVLRARALAS